MMRTLTYYVGTTIDGVIAAPDRSVDFFAPDEETLRFIAREFPDTMPSHARAAMGLGNDLARFDTVVMGRSTYEPALQQGIEDPYAHLRTFVVSSTLTAGANPNVTIVSDDPIGFVRALKDDAGGDIWLAGGGQLAGALLPEIDELVVKSYPLVAAAGVRLFGDAGFEPSRWTPTSSQALANGTVVTTYRRPGDTPRRA